ncbi:MAG: Rhodanese domain protein [Candidatus Magasanikbacteria bacterium GW2011_GWD2_43_18]|uniref:Rhodanese domain protein n=1 Tax=Candidatus Magasanikbacteria bacterium GW2011_GWE2_42_7 TaxID=1619052 RepID=A0A0G1E6R9_9BACT|nr:MAG: Rhodanese domain protein [Candidatus Magasanikbacteria bacterium GW2011_GWC2_42_27]KKS70253.1 MAG: Rhodanese domain protein [Candidatus Magasanikbacteria bacterium GW2011_GWE2_42_7]KKT04679.1 MAG: Rhodanese domain protein [Candidatus Magasanikbacteria bacterium GW2011_GWD2_43_18]KKT24548.1 MAG: Rhodanese domain protein [Candidatus Magasanikbacteria bacterium GW2011_GWA2_43_9]HBB37986.1 sulfurtransferase [Candidatus Magasanikbacteria bacterium]
MKNISVEEFKEMEKNGEEFFLLDVRTKSEWDGGHIDGSVQLSVSAVQTEIENVIPDKDTRIVVYCATGGRSLMAVTVMQMMGYTNLMNLEDGYVAYREV